MSTVHLAAFQLTVELPLKAIVRGLFLDNVIPITWRNRRVGELETEDSRDGKPILVYLSVRVAGKILQPRRLPPTGRLVIVRVVHLFESTKLRWIKKGETL